MTDFLRLNGIPIPIADGSADYSFEEHGSRQRAVSGTLRSTRSVLKRMWRFTTPVLEPERAQMIAGLIAGNGHRFSFDVDAFDLKGFGPLDPASTHVYSLRKGVTAAVPQPGEAGMKFGGAIAVEVGTTNAFASNVRTGTDSLGNTTGFTAVDAPGTFLSRDIPATFPGFVAFGGSRVLDVETSGVANGIRGGAKAAQAGAALTTYSASVYVQANGAIRAQLKDVTNGVNGSIETVATPEPLLGPKWTRLRSTVTTGAAAPTLEFEVLEDVADTTIHYYADAFQLEALPQPTSWVNGVRAVGLLRCDVQSFLTSGRVVSEDIRTAQDLTVMLWANPAQAFPPGGAASLFVISEEWGGPGTNSTLGHVLSLRASRVVLPPTSVLYEVFAGGHNTGGAAVSAFGGLGGIPWPDDSWIHFAIVLRRQVASAAAPQTLRTYVNGVLDINLDWEAVPPRLLPNLARTKVLTIGTPSTGAGDVHFSGGMIDDLVIVPYAMTAEAIAAVAAGTVGFSDLPRLTADGLSIVKSPASVTVLGELPSGEFIQAVMTATFASNNRTVDFTLTEV